MNQMERPLFEDSNQSEFEEMFEIPSVPEVKFDINGKKKFNYLTVKSRSITFLYKTSIKYFYIITFRLLLFVKERFIVGSS